VRQIHLVVNSLQWSKQLNMSEACYTSWEWWESRLMSQRLCLGTTSPQSFLCNTTTKKFILNYRLHFYGLGRECLNLSCLPKPSFADMLCCVATCRRHIFSHVGDSATLHVG
jgi:hypothetical protein